ncbi:MAG: glucose-1-phosphate adenylyltransferase [Gammaproteobacteria bacterium]
MASEESSGGGRFVSRLTQDTLALILAGGQGSRLYELTRWRAKPAVYFGGKLRIIDFPLSNCINSGIRRIGVLTQYKAHSLISHLVRGWSAFQVGDREFVEILPASQRVGGEWYRGTADAVYQNLDIIRTHAPKLVLILAGDHVYKMDYGVCCMEVPIAEAAGQLGVMTVDESGRIVDFNEKPEHPAPLPGREDYCLASMGNYVFNTQFLYEQVIKDADMPGTTHDFGRDVIPSVIGHYRVFAYPFRTEDGEQGYWRDVGTLDAYWQANMELNYVVPPLDQFVFDDATRRGVAIESMVSAGCIISGATIRRSVLFSNCRVHSHAQVELSVVLPDCEINEHARIRKAIIDRGTIIPEGMVIGYDHDEDRARGFRVTEGGHTLVTPDMLGQSLHFTR